MEKLGKRIGVVQGKDIKELQDNINGFISNELYDSNKLIDVKFFDFNPGDGEPSKTCAAIIYHTTIS